MISQKKKTLKGFIAGLLVIAGLFFLLAPHEIHETMTFKLNLPHFLHEILGIMIIGVGVITSGIVNFSKVKHLQFLRRISASKKIKFSILVILVGSSFLIFNSDSLKSAHAKSDFETMKNVAKECTNSSACAETWHEMLSQMDTTSRQKTAQEKIGITGNYEKEAFDQTTYLTTWNFNNLPPEEREKYYKEIKVENKTTREYWIFAEDKNIEVAPGIFFPAWTYNGQVPAPTIRATEGDFIRIHFMNKGTKPHTMHFHGFHDPSMDGSMPEQFVYPGENFTYEFEAEPYGLHLYHCHSVPLKQHIAKGLYGAYIVDPKKDIRPKPDTELVMIMNAFDTNLDGENEVYAVNSKAFYYALHPIKVKKDELVRIYLINIVEFDPVNSFHLHATFFNEYSTGTKQQPDAFTDITQLAQGERSILDVRFKYPGMYMFHAHVSEFTELGWMGFFEVEE